MGVTTMKKALLATATLSLVFVSVAQAAAPRSLMEEWNEDLAEIQEELHEKEWRKARRGAERLLDDLSSRIRSGDGAWNLFARVTLHRALAYAGAGEMEEAEWDWHMALTLDEEVAWSDLAEFGEAGGNLDAYRLRYKEEAAERSESADAAAQQPAGQQPAGPEITPPKKKRSPSPRYPWATKGVESRAVVVTIIGPDGRPRQPKLLNLDNPTQAFAALETVRRWRFEPATMDGKPVSIYYNLTVSFGWQGR